MKLKVENDRLIVYREVDGYELINKGKTNEERKLCSWNEKVFDIELTPNFIKSCARLLKPYIDSIPNCECGKK